MIHWEAHACLPLHPQASFAPIERFHAAGVHYVSINIGMDMNPLSQVMRRQTDLFSPALISVQY